MDASLLTSGAVVLHGVGRAHPGPGHVNAALCGRFQGRVVGGRRLHPAHDHAADAGRLEQERRRRRQHGLTCVHPQCLLACTSAAKWRH